MALPPVGRDDGDASANPGGRITRDVVLAAALELIDRDGVDGLSMRRLARVLDRDPMILYRHAPNKAALLDGVAETVLAQLKVDPADPDWAAQLRAVAGIMRTWAAAEPAERWGRSAELTPYRSRASRWGWYDPRASSGTGETSCRSPD